MMIQGYNSWEEIMEAIDEAKSVANARVKPWQAKIKTGDYIYYHAEDLDIYGKVEDDSYKNENRHYRFCRCYSVACPNGELGDVHVSQVEAVITKAEFEQSMLELGLG